MSLCNVIYPHQCPLIDQLNELWPFHWQFQNTSLPLKLYVIVSSWLYFRKIEANFNVIVWHSVDQKTQIQSPALQKGAQKMIKPKRVLQTNAKHFCFELSP